MIHMPAIILKQLVFEKGLILKFTENKFVAKNFENKKLKNDQENKFYLIATVRD